MSGELTIKNDGLATLIGHGELDTAIKPLVKKIHLFDSYVAGTTHLSDASVLQEIKVGDELTLQREDNKFDQNAILVLNGAKAKIGYIPEKDNVIFSRLMDAGKLLVAQIKDIQKKAALRKSPSAFFWWISDFLIQRIQGEDTRSSPAYMPKVGMYFITP